MQEIQKLEEEREREAKMRRDIQEAANARARQEEEARRQQVQKFELLFEFNPFLSNRYMYIRGFTKFGIKHGLRTPNEGINQRNL